MCPCAWSLPQSIKSLCPLPNLAATPLASPRLPQRFLTPGDLILVTTPCEITTILGPCVAVTFWCPRSRVAAICHAMLPSDGSGSTPPAGGRSWKFVSSVIPEMWNRFRRKGAVADSIEVKLFGGADLLHHTGDFRSARIGPQNVELAQQLLAERGLPILASAVGGKKGRKLIFNTQTGSVRVKRLPNFSLAPA
jgi:chemotaxis protein CheD